MPRLAVHLSGAVLLAGCLACAGLFGPPPVGPSLPHDELSLQLGPPEIVSVRRGDSLEAVAGRHGVTVADLRTWNGLESDRLSTGQILVVWTKVTDQPQPDVVIVRTDALTPAPAPSAAAAAPAAVPAPPPPPPAPGALAKGTAPSPGTVVIERPAVAGVLGMKVGSGVDLNDAAADLERFDQTRTSQLGDRSLQSGGAAESLGAMPSRPAPTVDPNAPHVPEGPITVPRLSKPIPKPCLKGANVSEVDADGGTSSGGLTVDQIRKSMALIGRQVIRCFPSGTRGTWIVEVEITAGCDGRASGVGLLDSGGVPASVTTCVTRTLDYAEFPAHGLTGGVTFQYPMKFTF